MRKQYSENLGEVGPLADHFMFLQQHCQIKKTVLRTGKALFLLALISGPYITTSFTVVFFYSYSGLIAYLEISCALNLPDINSRLRFVSIFVTLDLQYFTYNL
jgi:hypothetical protein